MVIPIHTSVRGVIFVSIILAVLAISIVVNNSRSKKSYSQSTGALVYFEKVYNDLPSMHKGDFRYLKIDGYPYIFEIYEPNSERTAKTIDDLKVGDNVDIYYYETDNTRGTGINRFARFIDRNRHPYFIENGFQKQLGYVFLGLCILMDLMAVVFWKMGKLSW